MQYELQRVNLNAYPDESYVNFINIQIISLFALSSACKSCKSFGIQVQINKNCCNLGKLTIYLKLTAMHCIDSDI